MSEQGRLRRSIADEITAAAEREEIEANLAAVELEELTEQARIQRKRAAELGSECFSRLAKELEEAAESNPLIFVNQSYTDPKTLTMIVQWNGKRPRRICFAADRWTGQLQIWVLTDVHGREVPSKIGFMTSAMSNDPARSIDPLDPTAEEQLVESISWVWDPRGRELP